MIHMLADWMGNWLDVRQDKVIVAIVLYTLLLVCKSSVSQGCGQSF